MWPYLPKKCNCSDEPTNENYVCEHCGLTTDDFAYDGEDLGCTEIKNQDSLTVSIQKIEEVFCGGEGITNILTTIANNPEEYSSFYTLVLSAFQCSMVDDCGPAPTTTTTSTTVAPTTSTTTTSSTSSSTTTSTTTSVPECVSFDIEALETNASWTALDCSYNEVGGVIPTIGQIINTGCIADNTLIVIDGNVVNEYLCITTTTTSSTTTSTTTAAPTTTTTSSSTTSTSSTTTTTTTATPTTTTTTTTLAPGTLVIQNETSSTVEDVYATAWLIGITTPCGPFTTMYGVHGNTLQPINVSITAGDGVDKCVSLWINGVYKEGITFSTTGVYTFGAYTVTNSSVVLVKVQSGVCTP